MTDLTSVGDTSTLTMPAKDDTVSVQISGTYNMTIQLQRELGSPGSGAWVKIKNYTVANATVNEKHTTSEDNERLQLIVLVDTSGTAVARLMDEGNKAVGHVFRDELGNTLLSFSQRGMDFVGNINGVPLSDATRAVLFEDFIGTWVIGDAGPADLWSSTAGSGAGNALALTVAASLNGEVIMESATDDGTHAANCSSFTGINLGYKANQGGLEMGGRVKIDDISEAVVFLGFTDVISTTVELPIFMLAGALDSDAVDACGLIYDIDATVDKFYVGGVDTNTDTDPVAANAVVPVDATYFTFRVKVSVAGVVSAWVNDTFIGRVAAAVTPTVALTPAIIIGNRSANQVIITMDYVWIAQNR